MTLEEKKQEMTKRVKEKLDALNFRITSIMTHFSKDVLLRDGTYMDALVTSFTEPTLDGDFFIFSNPETLEMLYVQTGPMNFMDIDKFWIACKED
jgi:hypothetical protein